MHRDVALGGYPLFALRWMWRHAALVALFPFLLSACGRPESVPPTPSPTPKLVYKVTVDVRGAPGEFVSAEGNVQYQISRTWKCMPMVPIQGTPEVAYIRDVKFPLKKVSPTRFVGYVVGEDRFVARDDYGLGRCDWELIGTPTAELWNGRNRYSSGHIGKCCPQYGEAAMVQRKDTWLLSQAEAEAKYGVGSLSDGGYDFMVRRDGPERVSPSRYFFINNTVERISQ